MRIAHAKQREGVPRRASRRRARKATRCAPRVGRALYDLNVQQYCCGGLNFGYFYDRSPIIAYDGEAAPPTRWPSSRRRPCRAAARRISGSTTAARSTTRWPGLHAAALRSGDRRAAAGRGGGRARRAADGARRRPRRSRRRLHRALVLSRPDQHVAWRGDAAPADPLALIDRLRGAAAPKGGEPPRPHSIAPNETCTMNRRHAS